MGDDGNVGKMLMKGKEVLKEVKQAVFVGLCCLRASTSLRRRCQGQGCDQGCCVRHLRLILSCA